MKIERTKNASRNLVFGTLLRGYQIVVPYLMRMAMIRFMGAGYLGLNGLFTSILHVLNLAELGVGSAMVYSMYQAIAEDDDARIDALMLLYRRYYRLIGLAVLVIGLALVPALPVLVNKDVPPGISVTVLYLMNLGATVLSYWLFAYRSSLIQAYQREDVISRVTIVSNTIQYALQLVAIIAFGNYYLYVVILLVGQVITNVLTALACRRLYPKHQPRGRLDEAEVKNINGRIRDLFTSKFGAVVLDSCDPLVITAFLGLEVLAIYQNYFYVITSLNALFVVFFKAIVAGVGNSLATESKEKNYGDFLEVSCITLCALGVCITCMLCLYQPFISVSFGSKYLLSFPFVILYCVFFYVYELCRMLNVFKDAAGIWHSDRLRPLVVSLLNLAINIVLVQFVGLAGVLLSTIVSYYFVNLPWLLRNVFSQVFERGMGGYLKKLALMTLGCLASGVLALAICSLLPGDGLLGITVRLVVGMTVGCVVMSAVGLWSGDLYRAIERLKRMVPQLDRVIAAAGRVRRKAAAPHDVTWIVLVALATIVCLGSGLIDRFFSLGVVSVALCMVALLAYVVRWGLRASSPAFVLVAAFLALVGVSTLISRETSIAAMASVLVPIATMALLFEASGGERFWLTLRVVVFTLSIMVILDVLSIIVFPKGLYTSGQIDFYTYYYLGYKSQRTWIHVPLVGLAAALSWHDEGRVTPRVYALWAVCLVANLLVDASMGAAALMVLGLGYVLLLVRAHLVPQLLEPAESLAGRATDPRVWALLFVAVAFVLYVPPLQQLVVGPVSAITHKSATLSGRTTIWNVALDLFLSSPLIGLGQVSSAHFISLTDVAGGTNPHSFYLSILVSGGVLGACLVTALYLVLLGRPVSHETDYRSLMCPALVANLFMGITSANVFATFTLAYLSIMWRVVREGQGEELGLFRRAKTSRRAKGGPVARS